MRSRAGFCSVSGASKGLFCSSLTTLFYTILESFWIDSRAARYTLSMTSFCSTAALRYGAGICKCTTIYPRASNDPRGARGCQSVTEKTLKAPACFESQPSPCKQFMYKTKAQTMLIFQFLSFFPSLLKSPTSSVNRPLSLSLSL